MGFFLESQPCDLLFQRDALGFPSVVFLFLHAERAGETMPDLVAVDCCRGPEESGDHDCHGYPGWPLQSRLRVRGRRGFNLEILSSRIRSV